MVWWKMSKRLTRGKSIRLKCLDCCANCPKEVRMCQSFDCFLWRYRMGYETEVVEEKG
jgi:hypothetical protein